MTADAALLKGFAAYLQLERSASANTVEAYLHDAGLLLEFLQREHPGLRIEEVCYEHLQAFLRQFAEMEWAASSQARLVSGIKAFFRYLEAEELIRTDPTALLEAPKQRRSLPDVLSVEEVERLLTEGLDQSTPEGLRNKAMLEVMYSCGLRVSETIGLQRSCLYLPTGLARVIGKGNKERLVPVGRTAVRHLEWYFQEVRNHQTVKPDAQDIVFLNRRGGGLSRMTVFNVVKAAAQRAGIQKEVHPHTLRHSFATHLVMNGADLRSVQLLLGHASILTTEIYTHLDQSFLRQTLERYHPRFPQ